MSFDSTYFGPEGMTIEDHAYAGSRYSEVRDVLFRNAYYRTWGASDARPLPVYGMTLGHTLRGLLRRPWHFLDASKRTVMSDADLRWGPGRRGFRRILHPNGVCLFGTWEIDTDASSAYSGYFMPGSRGLMVGRYSTSGSKVHRGQTRSLSLVGKIYPTADENHADWLRPANFFTQEDIGGERTRFVNDAIFHNAPNVTPWRRGWGLPAFIVTGVALGLADKSVTVRQLYHIAELGKQDHEETKTPHFLRIRMAPDQRVNYEDDIDFRDEILSMIYDKGDPTPKRSLIFTIEITDTGTSKIRLGIRRRFDGWKKIGQMVFREAVASYNGDFVVHFPHPPWRNDPNNPTTLARKRGSAVCR